VALAAAVEQRSEHPLAQAIIEEAVRRGVHGLYPPAEEVTALVGRGVTGRVDGHQVTIGSHSHFADIPHAREHCEAASEDAGRSNTPVMVGVDGKYMGTIALADTLRPTSRDAVSELRELGVASLTLLSGDNQQTAQSVAEQVGITDVMAELLPEHKVSAVEALRKAHGAVAMVGDGINDAPALATADVGIAVGAAFGGTAQAMETADIALMGDDMRRLPFAFRLSQATMRTVMVNVGLSLGIKAVFLVLVLAGLGTMWMAVLADMGVSLLVTVNGMRLLRRPTASN
jgi:Cd2+/Zn2+-exporting ATPase